MMKNRQLRVTGISLPYIDNAYAVSLTLLLNLLLSWMFGLERYDVCDIAVDAVICAVLTVVIDVWLVGRFVQKTRIVGAIPSEVPVSKLMMRLPKSPFGLIAILGTIFAVLCVCLNTTIFRWYGFEHWTFDQFLLYKLVYSLILSERIVSLCIFRFVQPDCDVPKNDISCTETSRVQPIKNPLPSVAGVQEFFATVSANLAMQLYFNPYVASYAMWGDRSIVMEGIIASAVTCFIVIGIITKTLDAARINGEFNVPPNRFLMRFPKNRWLFALLCAAIAGPVGAVLFVFLFRFYGFTNWTFYEFFWIKMAYLTLLGNVLVASALRRFTQPDIQ